MKRQFMACVVPLALACMGSPSALASARPVARIDQMQAAFLGGLTIRGGAAQLITVGRSGRLTRIDVPLCSNRRGSMVLLTVMMASGRHHLLARAIATLPRTDAACLWQTFNLRPAAPVSRRDRLWITLRPQRGQAPLWGSYGRKADPYRLGYGTWHGIRIDDFAFRTYVA